MHKDARLQTHMTSSSPMMPGIARTISSVRTHNGTWEPWGWALILTPGIATVRRNKTPESVSCQTLPLQPKWETVPVWEHTELRCAFRRQGLILRTQRGHGHRENNISEAKVSLWSICKLTGVTKRTQWAFICPLGPCWCVLMPICETFGHTKKLALVFY